MEEDNLTRQVDEVEAMSAIYGDDWCVADEINRIYCIAVSSENKTTICLQVLLPNAYPSEEPPVYQLNAPWLTGEARILLETSLADICRENEGESLLYLLVDRVREFLEETAPVEQRQETPPESEQAKKVTSSTSRDEGECHSVDHNRFSSAEKQHTTDTAFQPHLPSIELPPLIHGEPITDRRSTFQAHLAFPIVEVQQVKLLLRKLCENKKIANATHNIMAYRIHKEDTDSYTQDCDDDGETAAGGRLLHLLQIVDARNVMVVVSRWYGGILLGPDRFKHINNAARSVLDSSGFIQSKDVTQKQKKTKQKHR